jgi:hypothetical protein
LRRLLADANNKFAKKKHFQLLETTANFSTYIFGGFLAAANSKRLKKKFISGGFCLPQITRRTFPAVFGRRYALQQLIIWRTKSRRKFHFHAVFGRR